MSQLFFTRVMLILCLWLVVERAWGQQNCAFKPPVVKIDFGSGNIPDMNSYLSNYERDFSRCPVDGFYSYTSGTSNCFNGHWFTINQDHSAQVENGNMMLVNASETSGIFFNTAINGFTGNTTYQLTVSMMNVCRINSYCAALLPNITISIITPDGRKAAVFKTGSLPQGDFPRWRQLSGFFKTPPGTTSLTLTVLNNTPGGCGNDFAMDDIIIRECFIAKPEVEKQAVIRLQKPIVQKTAAPKQTFAIKPGVIKKNPGIIKRTKAATAITALPISPKGVKNDTSAVAPPIIRSELIVEMPGINRRAELKLPTPIADRANPIVRQIETEAGEILVELYDNGEIDGDTVTIYHNNQMVVSKASLSAKPISFYIKTDSVQPHHELIMVADNLGSIPPNTSMMIITANAKRYEVFISASDQKNARVVIDLKK